MKLRLPLACSVAMLAALIVAPAALGQNYIVLYKAQSVPADAATTIQRAGGTFVYAYPQIGVVIANSDSAAFRGNVLKDGRVANASGTAGFATQVTDGAGSRLDAAASDPPPSPQSAPVSGQDNLSSLQWDMTQMHAPEAHAITGGSSSILVGDIDTGLDYTHPDLAANVDSAASANCVGGAPIQAPQRPWTITVMARTPPGRSLRRRTESGSWEWRRACGSPGSKPAPRMGSSSQRR